MVFGAVSFHTALLQVEPETVKQNHTCAKVIHSLEINSQAGENRKVQKKANHRDLS